MAWHFGFNAEPLPRRCLDTLIFFVTGECNLSCEHCFYWQRLNRHEEITLEQIKAAFGSFGRIKNLLLSGGEPFLRNDLLEICNFFNRNNRVAFISIPTNGSLPGLIASKAEEILSNLDVALTIGLSLDGMEDYHDRLRGKDGLFEKVIETYGRLALLKKRYPCFSITVNPVVSRHNSGEVIRLARFVKDKMPEVDHFWFSIVRGNPRCPDQAAPDATELRSLYKTVNNIFYKDKRDVISQKKIWDKIFEIKLKVTERRRQIVPCQAGSSIGVLDANGDVRACELREPFGNIRMRDFLSVWNSYLADLMRKNIKDKVCHCTHECFIYPSVIKYGARRIIW
jgi:MoaA/NifB/PqqE/SkfB family radical SAM enzyme